ncbi:SPX domain-containing protein [Radiomyces spectabilis]|uniref:SPX domain-containing protein n=1 Tax=Radiomyces spectabilis TaxID=64574 RepID=UPI002220363D|nr:SPX domain-containing protein [Radiomyces spectabilis]KAI8370410.1 SPX domain-containing protein [Radiomyces spectabilis]
MKFGKQLETEAEDIPTEWRPYLIQYKALKKTIAKVAEEIEKRGLSASVLHASLGAEKNGKDNSIPRVKYYFTGEPPNVRPCIQFNYDYSQPQVQQLFERLIHGNSSTRGGDGLDGTLEYRRSYDNSDFFTLHSGTQKHDNAHTMNASLQISQLPMVDKDDSKDKDDGKMSPVNEESEDSSKTFLSATTMRKRRNTAAALLRELMDTSLAEKRAVEASVDIPSDLMESTSAGPSLVIDASSDSDTIASTDETVSVAPEIRSLVIELEHDDEFFHMLMTELQEAAKLQSATSQQFERDVIDFETRMVTLAKPDQRDDMYTWREIFCIYIDAQIFQGQVEADRTMRSVEKSKAQLQWFMNQMQGKNLTSKLKSKPSQSAFQQFLALNTELITMKHYQILNRTAMTKILKKHDKRSGLTASTTFPSFVRADKFFSPAMARMLCATIIEKVTAIIPQPDDYSCPICMAVAWRPIRLACNHVFCVRCLIKAQRKHMDSCPLCRYPNAVRSASAMNLDESMQNFLKTYFPREIKQKKKDNEREQAIEDIQTFTGRAYTEEQLMRMNRQHEQNKCLIM